MLFNTYQNDIISIIKKYVDNGFILSFSFSADARSNYIGFIQGSLDFLDDSRLFFKEYVDLQDPHVRLSYSFHYQDQDNHLIFRYDNAKHKPDLGYSEHKHIGTEIMPSDMPEIEKVILEIINEYLIEN